MSSTSSTCGSLASASPPRSSGSSSSGRFWCKPQNFDNGKLSLKRDQLAQRGYFDCPYCATFFEGTEEWLELVHKKSCPSLIPHEKKVKEFSDHRDKADKDPSTRISTTVIYETNARGLTPGKPRVKFQLGKGPHL